MSPKGESLGSELEAEFQVNPETPETKERANIYADSAIVQKLRSSEHPKIALLDIDSTMTGEPDKQDEARRLLEEQGYAVVYITARTEEMVMSKKEYELSVAHGFTRPAPKLGKVDGKHTPAFIDEFEGARGVFDPDVISGSTGTNLFVRDMDGGYKADTAFAESQQQESREWREGALAVIHELDPDGQLVTLEKIEDPANYEAGEVTVAPPDLRIQIGFPASGSEPDSNPFAKKQMFLKKLEELKTRPDLEEPLRKQLNNLRFTDDSKPAQSLLGGYLSPKRGYKARAAEEIISSVSAELDHPENLDLLISGDSYPDLAMGLYAGVKHKATFVIPGGSRLLPSFEDPDISEYAGHGISSIKKRLSQAEGSKDGVYEFKPPLSAKRKVVMGNEAYPQTKSVETLIAYLKDQQHE